jgi:hypothetical protein
LAQCARRSRKSALSISGHFNHERNYSVRACFAPAHSLECQRPLLAGDSIPACDAVASREMDFLLIVIIIQVLIFGSGWMLWDNRRRCASRTKPPAGAPAQLKARAGRPKGSVAGVSSAGRASRG